MSRTARILPIAVFAAGASWAQTTGSVTGVVKNALTHLPIEGVRVSVDSSSTVTTAVTTDSLGQFAFSKIEPGRLWLSASDQRKAASGGAYVVVTAGQETSGVEILLKVGGTISGKVLDDDGKPIPGVAIILLQRRFEFGELVHSPWLTVSTDKNGEYVLAPVAPERTFLILARNPLKMLSAEDEIPADPLARTRIMQPTYYPNSPSGQGAEAVTLAPGEDRREVNIRIVSVPPYCIEGKLDLTDVADRPSIAISQIQSLAMSSRFLPATAKTSPEGRFRACGFPPGEYQLSAAGSSGRGPLSWYAGALVTITDQDARAIRLPAQDPAAIPGEIVWDPPPRSIAADPRVSVDLGLVRVLNEAYADQPTPQNFDVVGTGRASKVQVPGAFRLAIVPPAEYQFDVRGLPPECYVKALSYGGADVRNRMLHVTSAEAQLRIVLACDGGSLTARVTDRDGNAVSQAHLYVMPSDSASEAAMSLDLRRSNVENGWSAGIQALAPGRYFAIACNLDVDGSAETLIKLWRARSKAKEVEIGPNMTVQLSLELAELN